MTFGLPLRRQNKQLVYAFAVASIFEKAIAPDFGNENRNPGLFYLRLGKGVMR